jgi:hypothetical protein
MKTVEGIKVKKKIKGLIVIPEKFYKIADGHRDAKRKHNLKK